MASIWVPWAPGSPLTVSSPLKAWTVPVMPTVGRYLSRSGVPKGDCGIVFERGCETSYDLALGFARDCAQRCQVAEPSVLAIPSSSPAPHREGPVCAWATETSAPAAANAHTNREVNIFRLPYICRTRCEIEPHGSAHIVIKLKRHDGASRRRRQGLAGISAPHRQATRARFPGLEDSHAKSRDMRIHHDTSQDVGSLTPGDLATRSRSPEMR